MSRVTFEQRAQELAAAREALLRFADQWQLVGALVCDCGDAACPMGTPEAAARNATVEELLGLLANEGERALLEAEGGAVDRQPPPSEVSHALLAFGEAFDVFVVQPALVSDDPAALWRFMDEEWHGTAGCLNHMASEGEARLVEGRLAGNLGAMGRAMELLRALPAERLRGAVGRFSRTRATPWYREAKHLTRHTLETWLPALQADARVQAVLEASLSLPGELGWPPAEARELVLALNDAALAVVVDGVASEALRDALYEPFAGELPWEALATLSR